MFEAEFRRRPPQHFMGYSVGGSHQYRNEDYEKSERLLSHVAEVSMKHDSSPAHLDVEVYAGLDIATVYLQQGQR